MTRILMQNGIDNTNLDGARDSYFNTGGKSGIVKDFGNECSITATSNTITLNTGELRLCGFRVVIDEAISNTLSSAPSYDMRYGVVASLTVANSTPEFSVLIQDVDTELLQNNLNNADGTYQLLIGSFTLNTDLTITDILKTADVFLGNSGSGGGGSSIALDTQVSTTSTNGVQNQAITNYVNNEITSAIGNTSNLLGNTEDLS
jgi:hypothetical protein